MVHIEVLTVAVSEHCVERVPLDADVVHKLGLNTEVRHQVLSSMTDVDTVMAIGSACLVTDSP
jgi:hypothetical protein